MRAAAAQADDGNRSSAPQSKLHSAWRTTLDHFVAGGNLEQGGVRLTRDRIVALRGGLREGPARFGQHRDVHFGAGPDFRYSRSFRHRWHARYRRGCGSSRGSRSGWRCGHSRHCGFRRHPGRCACRGHSRQSWRARNLRHRRHSGHSRCGGHTGSCRGCRCLGHGRRRVGELFAFHLDAVHHALAQILHVHWWSGWCARRREPRHPGHCRRLARQRRGGRRSGNDVSGLGRVIEQNVLSRGGIADH